LNGIQTVADALDRAPVPLHLLRDVVAAVGDRAEIWLDTGITSDADIVALALGANATMVGRAYLYDDGWFFGGCN
jgi:L-lactate dehydrogenase (cytochrome)